MNRTTVVAVLLVLVLAGLSLASPGGDAAAPAGAKQYVCPPCDMACDAKVFDQPGRCPDCGQALVEKAAAGAPAPDPRPKAAILIFDGVQIIDYTGPFEVLGQGGFKVFTVAEKKQPLKTAMGMTVVPEHTFADAPQADVLVVPGGDVSGPVASAATLAWVKTQNAADAHTMSVCNGAFILARAGLLDGLTATTFHGLIDELRAAAPKTKIVNDRRYVDNGHIITTAGLSSGIDGALHVVEVMRGGHGQAQATALHMEYDWRPESNFARAALADMLLPDVDFGDAVKATVLRTEGDTRRWDIVVGVRGPVSAADLQAKVDKALTQAHWTRLANDRGDAAAGSRWRLAGPAGTWSGRLSLEPDGAGADSFRIAMSIHRDA